jgi:transketolase
MMNGAAPRLARLAADTIKFMAADAVERAASGHPGMPMGMADAAFVLWSRYLRYDPTAPLWPDRDRFVLSAGHGCMLLYSLLHLAGYGLPLSEIERFRQWDSKTPGHPEFGHTSGVEATTGPLGQGVGNAVGMALAGKMLAARFNGEGRFEPVGHRVFAIASDGDLMEGVSGEASSLAGHLRLGNLVVLYDDNRITIEGATELAFSEDVGRRYEAYGWQVQRVDGHDHAAVDAALREATAEEQRPSLIACRTHIAHGAPTKQGSAEAHGAPLGAEELASAKRAAGWPLEPPFHVPDEVRAFFRARAEEGAALRTAWETNVEEWRAKDRERGALWDATWSRTVPADIVEVLLEVAPQKAGATRAHGNTVLQQAARLVPSLVGGSADLAPSTKTLIDDSPSVGPGEYAGRNLHFGIREHAMGAMVNGMLYHGAFRPYGATFLVFSDYMRPSIRLAALSRLPAIYVFTHDSIFVGEDGPTHEPIEHAFALRLIPGLDVWRPADGFETALAWGMALERGDGPSALLLSRQKLPAIVREKRPERDDLARGAYIVSGHASPDVVLCATGSELHLAVGAREALAGDGHEVRVVSIPCLDRLLAQPAAYRETLFPAGVPCASIEAGRTGPWAEIVGPQGLSIGIDTFGASAPAEVLADRFGFTVESVTARVRAWLG